MPSKEPEMREAKMCLLYAVVVDLSTIIFFFYYQYSIVLCLPDAARQFFNVLIINHTIAQT